MLEIDKSFDDSGIRRTIFHQAVARTRYRHLNRPLNSLIS